MLDLLAVYVLTLAAAAVTGWLIAYVCCHIHCDRCHHVEDLHPIINRQAHS